MVTRKTRVLSAIAVVLMLVSMFTCFVLPVTAATPTSYSDLPEGPMPWPDVDLVPFARHKTSAYSSATVKDGNGITHYAITDADDWLAAVAWSNGLSYTSTISSVTLARTKNAADTSVYRQTFENTVLWLTNDIDFTGFNGTITATNDKYDELFLCARGNNSVSGAFRGSLYGQGYSFKNFDVNFTYEMSNGNYDNLAIIGAGNGCTVRDLTIDASCSFTYRMSVLPSSDSAKADGTEHYTGVFMAYGAGPCTFINCRNFASLDLYDLNDGTIDSTWSGNTGKIGNVRQSISVFGRNNSGAIALINCFNAGALTNHDNGRATFVEWVNRTKENVILNCANVGAMSSAETDEVYSTFYAAFMSCNGTAGTAGTYANNYIVGYPVGSTNIVDDGDLYGVSLETGADASGELAYRLNAGYEDYTDVDRVYYTTNDSTEVGTAENATVKVELDFYGTKYTTYVNVGDSVDLADLHSEDIAGYTVDNADSAKATLQDGILAVTSAPADYEINVAMLSNEVQLDALKESVAVRKADGAENYTYTGSSYTGTLAELLAAIETKIADFESDPKGANAYTNNTEVSADLALLEEFVLADAISINLYEKYSDHEGFTVATKADMEYLATICGELSSAQTIYVAANIDMEGSKNALSDFSLAGMKASIDGGNKTISNLWIKDALLGDYAGSSIKDLTFKDSGVVKTGLGVSTRTSFLINDAKVTAEYSNLTFDNVTSSAETSSLTTGAIQGLIIGCLNGGNVTMKDITIINSTLSRPQAGAESGVSNTYWNSGMVIGKSYKGTLNVDGLTLNNNTLLGKRTGTGTGIVFGELICNAIVKNVAVTNTNVNPAYLKGVLLGKYKNASNGTANPVINIENVIAYNNGGEEYFMSTDAADTVETVNVTNVYTDATAIHDTTLSTVTLTNSNVDAKAAIESGEAAYLLNDVEAGALWAMDGTAPIFASATAKVPVAVTLKALDAALKDAEAPIATYTLYTDKDGKLIGLTEAIKDSASWDNEDGLAEAVFNAEAAVIGYTTPAHNHQFEYTDNGDGTHDAVCTFSHNDAELGLFECYYQELGVAHEIEKKNVTDTNTADPAATHQVVDDCKYCTYVGAAADCAGTTSEDAENSWETSCAGAGQTTTICDSCDYKHVKAIDQLEHTWGEWTHVDGTDTHKRTCANVANCLVEDQVENCKFETWNTTLPPEVGVDGEEMSTCECGNIATRPIPGLTGVTVNPGKAIVGKTFEVAIDLENNTKVAGMKLEITYDADLFTLLGAKKGTWDVVFDDNFPAASGVTTTQFGVVSNVDMTGEGTVIILEFAVKDDETVANVQTEIAVDVVEAFDASLAAVGFAGNKAEITIQTALIKGDINGDRFVNMADAILLLRYYTEKPQGETEWTINGLTIEDKIADISEEGDGVDLGEGQTTPEVNINDVLYLLRYLNGWYTDAEFFGE